VVTIWNGFRTWFRERGVDFDFLLYSQYERQVEALLDGSIDLAWNSPLAWTRAQRLARHRGVDVRAVAMRDTDRDLTSVIVVRADSDLHTLDDLRVLRAAGRPFVDNLPVLETQTGEAVHGLPTADVLVDGEPAIRVWVSHDGDLHAVVLDHDRHLAVEVHGGNGAAAERTSTPRSPGAT
jgi:hypothetical protein